MIHKKLTTELTEAMKSRDAVRLAVVRDLKSSFVNELITLGKKPDEFLDDENALKVIKRKANQRKDSIEQFEKGGRSELADKERAELEILESYLPAQMSEEKIREIVLQKK
ncbi:MAG: GatB/YqeY domain-containing protein, partial [Candidatus Paceibacterota bacterium]